MKWKLYAEFEEFGYVLIQACLRLGVLIVYVSCNIITLHHLRKCSKHFGDICCLHLQWKEVEIEQMWLET